MMAREKRLGFGGGEPQHSQAWWLAGVVIGMTVSNLAAAAMMLGAGAAIGNAITGKTLPTHKPTSRGY